MKVQITPNYIALALYLSSAVGGISAGEYQHRGGGGGARGDAIVPAARPGPAAEPRGDRLALVAANSHQDDPGGTLATIAKDKRRDDDSRPTKLNDKRGIGDIAEAAGKVVDTLHNVGSSSLTEMSTGDRQRLIGARPEPGATPSKWPPHRGVKWISPFNPWAPVGKKKDAPGRWLSKKQRAKNRKKDGHPRPAKKAKKEPKRPKKKGPPWVGPTIYDVSSQINFATSMIAYLDHCSTLDLSSSQEHPGPKGGFGPKTDPGGSAVAAAAAKREDGDTDDKRDFLDVLGSGSKIANKVQRLAGSGLPPAHWPRPESWHDRPGVTKRKRLPFSRFKSRKQAKAAKKEEPPWTPPIIHDEHPFMKGGFGHDHGPGSGGSIAVAAKRDDGHSSDKTGLLDIVEHGPGSGGAGVGITAKRDDEISLSAKRSERDQLPLSVNEKRAIVKLLENSHEIAQALRESGGVITTKVNGVMKEIRPTPAAASSSNEWKPSPALRQALLALPRPRHPGGRPKGSKNREGAGKPGPPKGRLKGTRGPYRKKVVICGKYSKGPKTCKDRHDSSDPGAGGSAGGSSAVSKRTADPSIHEKRAILELLENSDQLAHALKEAGGVITTKIGGRIVEKLPPGPGSSSASASTSATKGLPALPRPKHAGGRPKGVRNRQGSKKPGPPKGVPRGPRKGIAYKKAPPKGPLRGPYKKNGVLCGRYCRDPKKEDRPDSSGSGSGGAGGASAVPKRSADLDKRAILKLLEHSDQLAHALREAGGVITSKVNGVITETRIPEMAPKPKHAGGRPKGSKNKPKYTPHPQSPKVEAGPILFPQPLRYFDPTAHPPAADTLKKPLLGLPRPKHAGGRPKGSLNKQGAWKPGPSVGWSRPVGAKKPGPKAGTPRPLGAKKTGPLKGSRQKQGYKTGTKKGSVRGPYKKKHQLHDDRPGPSDDGSGSGGAGGASSATAARKRAILELLENSTQFAHALRAAGGVVTSKVNGVITETQHELPPSQQHAGGPVLNPEPLRSFDGAAHAAASAPESWRKRKRRPGAGRPKGVKNKEGSLKPGPVKGRPRAQRAKRPGPLPGTPRPEGAKKPGPLPGTPRPEGSKKPGPAKGTPRPLGLNKPGPKKGSKQKQGYKVGKRGRPRGSTSKKYTPKIFDSHPSPDKGPGPNGDGAEGTSSAIVATKRSIDEQQLANRSNEKRVVGEILEGLGGVFRNPALEKLENVGQGATANVAPSALQRLVKSKPSQGAGSSNPLRKGPHWRELIRQRRRKGAQKHKKLKGQWQNAHGLGSSSSGRRALDGSSAEFSLELVRREEVNQAPVNRGIGELAEAFEHAVKIQEKVSDHLKAESSAGLSPKAKPFAALKKELRRLPAMRPSRGTPFFKKTARKAKKAISGKGDKMLLDKNHKRGFSELAEAFDKAVKIEDKVSDHDEPSPKPASSALTKPSSDKSRVIRPKRKKESHHSPYADDAEQQKLFRWAKNRDPRREWAKSLSLAFKHPDRHHHAKAPSPPKSPPAASSGGDEIHDRGIWDLAESFSTAVKIGDKVSDHVEELSSSRAEKPDHGKKRVIRKKNSHRTSAHRTPYGDDAEKTGRLRWKEHRTPPDWAKKGPIKAKGPGWGALAVVPRRQPSDLPPAFSSEGDAKDAIDSRGLEDLVETFHKGMKLNEVKDKVVAASGSSSSIPEPAAEPPCLRFPPAKKKFPGLGVKRSFKKKVQKEFIVKHSWSGKPVRFRNPLFVPDESSPAKSQFKPPKKHRQSLSTKSPSVSPCSSPPSGSPCKSPEVSSDGSHAMVIGRRGSEDLFENFDKDLKIVHDAREKVSQGPRHGNGET